MSDAKQQALSQALINLEQAMIEHELWSEQRPSDAALSSQQPFAVDTLDFAQWLQFIMLPTFTSIIRQQRPLPNQCDIHSMAQQVWQDQYLSVQACILIIDQVVADQGN